LDFDFLYAKNESSGNKVRNNEEHD